MENRLPLLIWFILVVMIFPTTWVLFRNHNEHRKLSWFRKYKLFHWLCSAVLFIGVICALIKVEIISDEDQISFFGFFFVIPFIITFLAFLNFYRSSSFRRMNTIVDHRNDSLQVRMAAKKSTSHLLRIGEPMMWLVFRSLAVAFFVFGTARVFIFSTAPHELEEQCSSIISSSQGRKSIGINVADPIFNRTTFFVSPSQIPAGNHVGRKFCILSRKGHFGYRQIWTYEFR